MWAMGPSQLLSIIMSCAPSFAPSTAQHIIAVESGGNELAIGVNGQRLLRQPRNREEAIAWARWFQAHGYNVDVGLWQVNIRNWAAHGMTPENAFDPCTNTRVGSAIFRNFYAGAVKKYGYGQPALLAAISAYNTGNFQNGFKNGYVARVVKALPLEIVSTTPTAGAK